MNQLSLKLLSEFFQVCIEEMAGLLTSVFNSGIRTGMLHKSLYHGMISLIYKKGDTQDIENWRDFSLMNVNYKIIAKVFTKRLKIERTVERQQTFSSPFAKPHSRC